MTHKLQCSSSTIIFILFLTVIVVMASSKFAFGHSSMWDFGINYHVAVDLFNRGTVSRMFDWHVLGLMPLYGFFDVFGDLGPYSIIALQSTFVFTGLYFAMESLPDFFHNPRWSLFFLLFPPIWFNLLFDIRWDPLIIIVLGLFYYTAQKPGNGFFLFLLGVMACLIKEVFALSAIAMGMYLLLHSANRRIYVGSLLILFGISYFLFVGNVVMPFFNGQSEATDLWNKAFGYLGNGFGEMLVNLVTHPWILVTEVISTP